MYIFRLFEQDNPLLAVDARLLAEGSLSIGRDPSSDWVMIDPDCEISRNHCTVRVEAGQLLVRCEGANGIYDDATHERLPNGEDVILSPPQAIRIGHYRIVAERAPQGESPGCQDDRTLIMAPPIGASIDVPSSWVDAPEPLQATTAGTMFDAFCRGAGLDASMFGDEDPADVLYRAGAVYQQMVLGVGDLMAERDKVRRQYRLAHTTISGANNNPFKWAPTQRLARDLLRESEGSFLSGPAALRESFRDVKKHIVATFKGFQAALQAAVDDLAPAAIEAATEGQSSLLKGRAAVCWDEARRRQAVLLAELNGSAGALDRAFVKAYETAEADLEGTAR